MHAPGPDLQFDRVAARADYRRMQRLVHVELRHRYIVFEPARYRVPAGMRGTEHRIAVADGVHQDADAHQVVDVVEALILRDHLLVHRVHMLRAAGDPGLDLGLAQVCGDLLDHVLQERFAARRALGDQPRDLVVPLGEQRGEREILKLPLDRIHPEPVRERRVDLKRLAGLALLLRPGLGSAVSACCAAGRPA